MRMAFGELRREGLPSADHGPDEIIWVAIADLNTGERRQLGRQKIDAVIDKEATVDFGSLSGNAPLQEMLTLGANAADQGVERPVDLRAVARKRDRLLQLHQLVASPLSRR